VAKPWNAPISRIVPFNLALGDGHHITFRSTFGEREQAIDEP
jgi:hypothetical protein